MLPKNFRQILSCSKTARDYFLKPRGVEAPLFYKFDRPQEQKKFVDLKLKIHRPFKQVSENTICFKCPDGHSKPQLKQYISKLYGIQVQKVHTARFMGKVVKDIDNQPKLTKPFKKIWVMTNRKFDQVINTKPE